MSIQVTFHALSDPTRRAILSLLQSGPLNAQQIVDRFDITNATVSHHLSILKKAGLIIDDKQGKYIYYELNTSVFEDVLTWIYGLGGKKNEEN